MGDPLPLSFFPFFVSFVENSFQQNFPEAREIQINIETIERTIKKIHYSIIALCKHMFSIFPSLFCCLYVTPFEVLEKAKRHPMM